MGDSRWQPSWGAALERGWGPLTAHAEAFGVRHAPRTVQAGLRYEATHGWQWDGTLGRQAGRTLLSLGAKQRF